MLVLVLDNLRSKHNVGSIFRTADATGVDRIYLCGTTPQPYDRFGRPVTEIKKTALGAERTVSFTYHQDTLAAIQALQNEAVPVWSVEQTPNARDLVFDSKLKIPQSVAFVFGNEVTGVDNSIISCSDGVLALPMAGSKESLNVSVAVGAVLYLHQQRFRQ